ncbi:GLC7-interacting protein 2 [Turnera subulata]|uniref:GLC7-interacting protein 2 n=1 Tax=Turnera subulata TaxID=218843 RepID=A0A9Q0G7Z0_9ROSI|nr:GLC7-interacting protein 2 [Turnera subulata]
MLRKIAPTGWRTLRLARKGSTQLGTVLNYELQKAPFAEAMSGLGVRPMMLQEPTMGHVGELGPAGARDPHARMGASSPISFYSANCADADNLMGSGGSSTTSNLNYVHGHGPAVTDAPVAAKLCTTALLSSTTCPTVNSVPAFVCFEKVPPQGASDLFVDRPPPFVGLGKRKAQCTLEANKRIKAQPRTVCVSKKPVPKAQGSKLPSPTRAHSAPTSLVINPSSPPLNSSEIAVPHTSNTVAKTSFSPKALVLPVTKDSSAKQFVTQIHQRTPLVPVKLTLDLGGQYLWVDCQQGYQSSSYRPAPCNSAQCELAGSKSCTTTESSISSPKPGCNNNNNTCGLFPDNTVTGTATSGDLGQDVVSIQSTDGFNPGRVVSVPNLLFSCGSTFLLQGLANGVKGMAGLGRTKISLPSQFSAAFSFPNKFALCLGVNEGVVFFGDGPYVLLPGIDVSKLLSYTPLILNPVSTATAYFQGDPSSDYFIGVEGIKINGKMVPLNTSLLAINKEGYGGTKITTVHPYTVMETSTYNAVIKAFAKELSGVPRVSSVAPLDLCFDSNKIISTRLGPGVPRIDLLLEDGNSWAIFGANSMVKVKRDVMCLGIVDGGANPRTSVVIGGHQLVNYLLQFDLASSRLGFSSTLLSRGTNCANFNFSTSSALHAFI